MRGTLVAYYIHIIIFFLISFGTLFSVHMAGTIGLPGQFILPFLGVVVPSLLLTGWVAWVLQGCVESQKNM